jgi:O-glycosyl hydrolase
MDEGWRRCRFKRFDGGAMKNHLVPCSKCPYTAKYCEAYKAEGIPIKAVCPQNEPGYTQKLPYLWMGAIQDA